MGTELEQLDEQGKRVFREITQRNLEAFHRALPAAVQRALSARNYTDKPWSEAVAAYMSDAAQLVREHDQRNSDTLEGMRRDAEKPTKAAPAKPESRRYTAADIEKMDLATFRKLEPELLKQLPPAPAERRQSGFVGKSAEQLKRDDKWAAEEAAAEKAQGKGPHHFSADDLAAMGPAEFQAHEKTLLAQAREADLALKKARGLS
jgi:hypothetical protein